MKSIEIKIHKEDEIAFSKYLKKIRLKSKNPLEVLDILHRVNEMKNLNFTHKMNKIKDILKKERKKGRND